MLSKLLQFSKALYSILFMLPSVVIFTNDWLFLNASAGMVFTFCKSISVRVTGAFLPNKFSAVIS